MAILSSGGSTSLNYGLKPPKSYAQSLRAKNPVATFTTLWYLCISQVCSIIFDLHPQGPNKNVQITTLQTFGLCYMSSFVQLNTATSTRSLKLGSETRKHEQQHANGWDISTLKSWNMPWCGRHQPVAHKLMSDNCIVVPSFGKLPTICGLKNKKTIQHSSVC